MIPTHIDKHNVSRTSREMTILKTIYTETDKTKIKNNNIFCKPFNLRCSLLPECPCCVSQSVKLKRHCNFKFYSFKNCNHSKLLNEDQMDSSKSFQDVSVLYIYKLIKDISPIKWFINERCTLLIDCSYIVEHRVRCSELTILAPEKLAFIYVYSSKQNLHVNCLNMFTDAIKT